ncbi:hypothetical protein F66182_4465 [Fusarium sp. NRRL 66182]|nr:hypothetical protein F66182_4465 [Fusarium sp. NRRL 66182]
MHHLFRSVHQAEANVTGRVLGHFSILSSKSILQRRAFHSTVPACAISPNDVQCVKVPELSHAEHPGHVQTVSKQLERSGILKISLDFPDHESEYLKRLLVSLHRRHGHQLPISHSAAHGWFWDVRPSQTNFQAGNHQARSETMDEFPWHTDCSYEDLPPRYFALQVLQHDRFGGGTLSIMNVQRLAELLSPETQSSLAAPEYRITIPPEFIKNPTQEHITGSVLVTGSLPMIRFREDILTPLTERAARALEHLKRALLNEKVHTHATVHLKAADLPKGSIVLIDNRRWLHARNDIKDPERHLRRVRWDACAFI